MDQQKKGKAGAKVALVLFLMAIAIAIYYNSERQEKVVETVADTIT